jgi:hypothetical protein
MQGVWRHQGTDLQEPFPTDRLGLGRESPSLLIRESQSLSAELLAQYSILLLQVLDDILLTTIHPSREGQHQKLKLEPIHGLEGSSGAWRAAGGYRPFDTQESDRIHSRFRSAEFSHTTG